MASVAAANRKVIRVNICNVLILLRVFKNYKGKLERETRKGNYKKRKNKNLFFIFSVKNHFFRLHLFINKLVKFGIFVVVRIDDFAPAPTTLGDFFKLLVHVLVQLLESRDIFIIIASVPFLEFLIQFIAFDSKYFASLVIRSGNNLDLVANKF